MQYSIDAQVSTYRTSFDRYIDNFNGSVNLTKDL